MKTIHDKNENKHTTIDEQLAQSNWDEEHIMLLAMAMHSSQYHNPSDRVEVIKKWLTKYNESDK